MSPRLPRSFRWVGAGLGLGAIVLMTRAAAAKALNVNLSSVKGFQLRRERQACVIRAVPLAGPHNAPVWNAPPDAGRLFAEITVQPARADSFTPPHGSKRAAWLGTHGYIDAAGGVAEFIKHGSDVQIMVMPPFATASVARLAKAVYPKA